LPDYSPEEKRSRKTREKKQRQKANKKAMARVPVDKKYGWVEYSIKIPKKPPQQALQPVLGQPSGANISANEQNVRQESQLPSDNEEHPEDSPPAEDQATEDSD
jgi:hypothetical protein